MFATAIAISACSSAAPATPVTSESPAPPGYEKQTTVYDIPPSSFIASQDCDGLQHGFLPRTALTISSGDAIDITLQVEVADEAGEQSQGLMCRESVPPGTGMLFTYDTDRSNGFWMFNTYVPIDILYLDQFGHVVDNITMSPCTRDSTKEPGLDTSTDDEWRTWCATEANAYVPAGPWRNTLELPAGWLETKGLGGPRGQEITVSWVAPGP